MNPIVSCDLTLTLSSFRLLSRFILPCRSLCTAVRDSCAPVLACQGHAWPQALDCDRFPAEEDMCLSPHPKFPQFTKGTSQPPLDYNKLLLLLIIVIFSLLLIPCL